MPIPNSPPRKVAWLPALTAVLFAGTLALGDDRSVRVNGRITDAATGQAVAARLYIRGDDGKHFFARSSDPRGSAVVYDRQRGRSFERHTTLSAHAFEADLPPGSYTLIAERGKEYLPKSVDLRITDRPARVDIPLRRWIDMAARGWYSGDTHVHRSLADLPNIVAAEDLNVTFPLVYWVTKAFEESRVINSLTCVNDGVELIQYLRREGEYAEAPRPDIILLDLNMPRMDGREALAEIKKDPDLRLIPVVVLTTSDADEDILRSYSLGASSYVQKPVTFDKMVETVETIGTYWLGIVKLPHGSLP